MAPSHRSATVRSRSRRSATRKTTTAAAAGGKGSGKAANKRSSRSRRKRADYDIIDRGIDEAMANIQVFEANMGTAVETHAKQELAGLRKSYRLVSKLSHKGSRYVHKVASRASDTAGAASALHVLQQALAASTKQLNSACADAEGKLKEVLARKLKRSVDSLTSR